MKNILNNLSNIINIIMGIYTLSPIIYSLLISSYTNKSFTYVLSTIPRYFYFFFIIPLIIYCIYKITSKKKQEGIICVLNFYNSDKYKKYDEIEHNGLLWFITIPKIFFNEEIINIYQVDPKPRCPNCKMKLKFSNKLFYYKWKCMNCNYNKRTLNHEDKIISEVRIIYDYILENS